MLGRNAIYSFRRDHLVLNDLDESIASCERDTICQVLDFSNEMAACSGAAGDGNGSLGGNHPAANSLRSDPAAE
jgi:hypothetical protein